MISGHDSYLYSDTNDYNRPAEPVNETRPGRPSVDISLQNLFT